MLFVLKMGGQNTIAKKMIRALINNKFENIELTIKEGF